MRLLVILTCILLSFPCYAQQQANEVRAYYGFTSGLLLRNARLSCAGSYEIQNPYELGAKYMREVIDRLYIEAGINYYHTQVKISSASQGSPIVIRYESLDMVSLPIYVNYTFGKYFFLNGGPIFDFQHADRSFDSQYGIGYSLGVGGKHSFGDFLIYVNPNFKRHAWIPFKKERYHQKLTEFGVQIGIGYKF